MKKKKNNKIRLLFCINSLSAKGGGAEKILSIISNELSLDEKYEIHILTFDKPYEKLFYNFSKNININKTGNYEFFTNKILKNINRIFILLLFLNKIKPKISFGFMHSNYINLSFASLFSKSKIVACEHIVPEHYENKKLEYKLIFFCSYLFDKITVVSNQVKNLFPKHYKKKMVVVNNFVIPIKKQEKTNFKKTNTIISIGRIEEQKNYLTLIYAFNILQKTFKNWKLKIIGDGSKKKQLLETIKYFKLTNKVQILNYTKNLYPHYKSASLYVCSSIYESFGLTVAEAINFNLPVIGFKSCTGINELISNHKYGILVNTYHYDYKTLGNEMIRIIKFIKKNKIKKPKNNNLFKKNSKKIVLNQWIKLINNLKN